MRNLTREAAERRADLLDVHDYEIHLDVTDGGGGPGAQTFTSRTQVTFSCTRPGTPTFVDLVADAVTGATLNGVPLDVGGYDPEHGLAVPAPAERNVLVVDAVCRYSHTGEGLHRFVDPVDGEVYLYSMLCVAEAQRMYACCDQPDLKARFTFSVTAPARWQVLSNGAAAAVTDAGRGAVTVRFATTPPLPTYVTCVAAGPYHRRSTRHDGIDLGVYCRRSLAAALDDGELFAVTTAGFDYYHRIFGVRYPYGKYDQVFVPEFNAGAMENAGCVVFTDDLVFQSRVTDAQREWRASVVLHELAHMWFGDLVTARWWDDLWLNESFATFIAALAQAEATRWADAWATFAHEHKTWAYEQDQLSSSHPIVADIPDVHAVEVNFDGITYAKGASVLKQLVASIGRDAFLAALPVYFRRHAHGNATLGDLLAVLGETSGRDLSAWARQWLQTAQVNTVTAECEVDTGGTVTTFALTQTAPEKHPLLRPHRLAVGLYERDGDRLRRAGQHLLDLAGARTEVTGLTGRRVPELVLVNDDDLAYAKVRLDGRSLAAALEGVGTLADPLARTVCWSTAWDMTRDAELPARDFVRLVLGNVAVEPAGVMATLLGQAGTALSGYADPGWAATGWRLVADTSWEGLHTAAAGSDQQLVWARTFAGAAHDPASVDRLQALYEGSDTADGLVLDLHLRWSVLLGLVAAGRAADAEINAEVAREPGSVADQRAATASALRPEPHHKAEAWRRAVADDTLPYVITRALTQGVWHPAQAGRLTGFVDRYFADIGPAWRRHGTAVAATLAAGLFPAVVDATTVAAADAWLAHDGSPPPLRRLVGEGRDRTARAVRCRALDAAAGTDEHADGGHR